MIKLIFSVDENITKYLVDKFELTNLPNSSIFKIYKKWWIILVASSEDEATFRESFIFAYSEYNPDIILFAWEWSRISTDVRDWDIILPNVFFELDDKINELELDLANRDSYIANPVFLEQYHLQKDYDFENFGLSIGWICITSNKTHFEALNLENIRIAYEPDIFDTYSYYFVDEAKKLDLLSKTYVILGANSYDKNISIEHISHIVSFLFDNIDREDMEIVIDE